jgi:hypothetical protein
MAQRGRKPVLDEIKQCEIVALLTMGYSRRVAAQYVGCAPSTIQNTARRDRKFAKKIRQAAYNTEISYLKNIQKAANKEQYWRAAAWVLERTIPEKYARRGPDVITVEQISSLLSQFTDIITEEVPVGEYRKNIIKRMEALNRSLGGSPRKRANKKGTGIA